MNSLRVSAVGLAIEFGDIELNLRTIRDAVTQSEPGPHLLVLTELATTGYVFADRDEARALSMCADDDQLTSLADLVPDGNVLVFGFCERDGEDLYNSALVVGRGAVLGHYRKSHLWDTECQIFTPGSEAGTVVDTPIGRLGVAICYDNEFPELPRRLALRGARVLALPVNWPRVERPAGALPPETIQAMAAARSSRLPTVITDRHGTERGVEWTGGTTVISADGWICATPDDHGIASAEISVTDHKTVGPHNDLFADRRPDLYGDITTPHEPHSAIERGIHA